MSPNLKIGNVRPNVRKQKTNFLLLEYCFFLTFFSIDVRAASKLLPVQCNSQIILA